jgi:hypothetical protein
MSDQVGEAVKSAIGDGVSVIEWIAAFGNMDDQIGSAVFRFSHGQLQGMNGAPIPFNRRWDNEGDWELFGHITATPIRRQEPKCCDELKGKIKELEKVIADQGKRIDRLENPRPKDRYIGKITTEVASRPKSRGPVVK